MCLREVLLLNLRHKIFVTKICNILAIPPQNKHQFHYYRQFWDICMSPLGEESLISLHDQMNLA